MEPIHEHDSHNKASGHSRSFVLHVLLTKSHIKPVLMPLRCSTILLTPFRDVLVRGSNPYGFRHDRQLDASAAKFLALPVFFFQPVNSEVEST